MGGSKGGPAKLIVNGKRLDGRKFDQIRDVEIEVGIIPNADGSCRLRLGGTEVLVSVYGPRELHPKHLQLSERAYLNCYYDMASFSTKERCRPGQSRRSKEISMLMTSALSAVVMLEKYPRAGIDVYAIISNASGGTRCAAITAAAVALADAGIEMKDMVSAVAVGKIEGKLVLDMFEVEDNYGQGDLPVAIMPQSENLTLLQLDGDFSPEELKEGIQMAVKACKELNKKQREAIQNKYKGDADGDD